METPPIEIQWATVFISLIVGLGSGVFGALLNNHYDCKKQKNQYRKDQIIAWRKMIAELCAESEHIGYVRENIAKRHAWLSLQPHISEDVMKELRSEAITVVSGDAMRQGYYEGLLLQEIARIEKKWKLI